MVDRWKDKLSSIDEKQSTISNIPPSHPPKPEQTSDP